MMHRFRDLILLITAVFAGVGYLIDDYFANRGRSDELLIVSGASCCAIAVILLFQLFLHGRDPREPTEE